jgi:hypothetical protein
LGAIAVVSRSTSMLILSFDMLTFQYPIPRPAAAPKTSWPACFYFRPASSHDERPIGRPDRRRRGEARRGEHTRSQRTPPITLRASHGGPACSSRQRREDSDGSPDRAGCTRHIFALHHGLLLSHRVESWHRRREMSPTERNIAHWGRRSSPSDRPHRAAVQGAKLR